MRGVSVGRIGGVPVHVERSWVVVLALAGAAMFLRVSWDGTQPVPAAVVAVVGAALLLASVLVHEAGHAMAARRVGVVVRKVSLFLFGGYTEMVGEPDRPSADLIVALAGPAASLAAAAVLAVVRLPLVGALPGAADVLGLLAVINLGAAGFNLLPGLPLDGGRVLRALHWGVSGDRVAAERWAAGAGRVVGALLVAVGIGGAVMWRTPLPLVAVGIGWFVHAGAVAEGRTAGARATPVAVVMSAAAPPVGPGDAVAALEVWVPVVSGGRVVGMVPPGKPGTASDVMVLIEPDDVVEATMPVGEAAVRKGRTGRFLVVVEEGRMVGVVAPGRLADWLQVAERRQQTD